MKVGFIVTRTPAEEGFKSFQKLLDLYIQNNDITIYLVGNGVFAAKRGMIHSPIKQIVDKVSVNVSAKDLKARGLTEHMVIDKVLIFNDFEDMVSEIMENMDQVLSF
jgi:tRNA 2-thiouridine synthesizing protein B